MALLTSLFQHFLPETILSLGVFVLLIIGAWRGEKGFGLVDEMTVGLLGLAILSIVLSTKPDMEVFDGAFMDDGFSRFVKVLTLLGALVSILMSVDYLRRSGLEKFEFPVLVILSTLGMLLLISADNLIALYLGLELMSLALYVMAAFARDDGRASEAGLKYFVLGALSSGMMLYGSSLLYGCAGTVSFSGIAAAVSTSAPIGVIFGLVFVLAGLAFKMSAAPFHMWTPDVYEGAPTPVTAFFASAAKMAAVAITARFVITAFPGVADKWRQIVVFLAIASTLLGSFAAIGQNNIKRLMAYSSIANMGFVLMALAAGPGAGATAALLYLALYLPATIGIFAIIQAMWRQGRPVEDVNDLAGLAQRQPWMAYILTALLFSLTGIPPLAGFFGKYYVFNAAVQAGGGFVWLAVFGILASAIGAYYYLRVVVVMLMKEPAKDQVLAVPMKSGYVSAALAISGAAVMVFGMLPGWVLDLAIDAAQKLLG